ncbi:MAG: C25 family cysteine peptidase [Candidatus Thermoplasmatota archaeon]
MLPSTSGRKTDVNNFGNIPNIKISSSTNAIYQLLIVAPKVFIDELEPLVCHKQRMGISTRLVTLDEIYHQMYWHGRDQAEKIKYYIKTAIEEWGIKYVLLVGGKKGQLPFWYVPVRYLHMANDWESEILSDLYYADIYDAAGNFSTWDSDGDGDYGEWIYGETPEDINIDLTADVAVGRLPCRNEYEVSIMVDKIITYETKTWGQSWFNRMVVAAGDTYPESHNPNWTGYEGEYYGDQALENMTGFFPVRLYTSSGTLTGFRDVQKAVNPGCGFLYFVGHGSPKQWGNNNPNGTGFVHALSTTNVHRLNNNNRYPVCVLSGCHNLQFDVNIFRNFNKTLRYRQEGVFECLGWRLTRVVRGGSIATLGATALGFTKEDKHAFIGGINELEVAFFEQYGTYGQHILGDAWRGAINWYTTTYPINWLSSDPVYLSDAWIDVQVPATWILFGDPSLLVGGYQPLLLP